MKVETVCECCEVHVNKGKNQRGTKAATKQVPAGKERETVSSSQNFIDWEHWAQVFPVGTDDPLPHPPGI